MPVLSEAQRDYLVQIAWSEKAIDTVEKQMKFSRRRYRTAVCFAVAALLLTIFLGVWYFGVEHPLILVKGPSKVFVGTFLAVYICYSLLVVYAFLSVPEYRAFKALIRSVDFFDRAMRAKPAAGARRRLAAQISRSAFKIRACGARMPWRLDRRILRQEANRACQALRQFVYPALLGTDDELRQVKVAIARAAIRVGTRNWVQVGDLAPDSITVPRNMRPRLTLAGIISFLIILVPLITALVSALTSNKSGQASH